MNSEFISHSVAETQEFAKKLAQKVKPGDLITLSGDLGAGKTTFVQGFARGLGIIHRIISPTFVVIRTYKVDNNTVKTFYHIDLYRMQSEKDLESIGLQEILEDNEAIVVIEWPERMGSLLPEKKIEIAIETLAENSRSIHVRE